jgi:hypothetical protein
MSTSVGAGSVVSAWWVSVVPLPLFFSPGSFGCGLEFGSLIPRRFDISFMPKFNPCPPPSIKSAMRCGICVFVLGVFSGIGSAVMVVSKSSWAGVSGSCVCFRP